MKHAITTGLICLKDNLGFEYCIAIVTYTEREDGSYTYSFQPDYSVISLLPPILFQGIPGINLDKHKVEYRRENMTPVFISERTPSEGREDLWTLLEQVGMKYLNRLEWLIRTDTQYGGDRLYVKRYDPSVEKQTKSFDLIAAAESRSSGLMQKLIAAICQGHNIVAKSFTIDDSNRKSFHDLLLTLYQKEKMFLKNQKVKGIQQAAANGHYAGRKTVSIDAAKLDEVFSAYQKKKINRIEAMQKLGVSRATFYRRLKAYRNELCADVCR